MKYNPEIHHRHSIRLRGYDYARGGAYFITLCAQDRACLFGGVAEGGVVLSEAGQMVAETWQELSGHYPGVDVDAHVVMPNHFHGIIILTVGAGPCACPDVSGPCACPGPRAYPCIGHPQGQGHPQGGAPTLSLFDVVHRFKSLTTVRHRHNVKHGGWPPFPPPAHHCPYCGCIVRGPSPMAGWVVFSCFFAPFQVNIICSGVETRSADVRLQRERPRASLRVEEIPG